MFRVKRRTVIVAAMAGLLALVLAGALAAPRALANGPANICDYDGYALGSIVASEAQIEAALGPFSKGDVFPITFLDVVNGEPVWYAWRIAENLGGGNWVVELIYYIPGCAPPNAPALFLMDVCEPVDGFSADGWQSWDSNANVPLYVAPGPDGPWSKTEFAQPPYIISTANADALTTWMGAASYGALWFKAGENGQPVNVGSAAYDRSVYMDGLCSVE